MVVPQLVDVVMFKNKILLNLHKRKGVLASRFLQIQKIGRVLMEKGRPLNVCLQHALLLSRPEPSPHIIKLFVAGHLSGWEEERVSSHCTELQHRTERRLAQWRPRPEQGQHRRSLTLDVDREDLSNSVC